MREALSVLGATASGPQVKAHIVSYHPHLKEKAESASFSSGLSNEKTKMRKKAEQLQADCAAMPAASGAKTVAVASTKGDASAILKMLEDVKKLKQLQETYGTEGLKLMIEGL